MIATDPSQLPILLADVHLDRPLPADLGAGTDARAARLLVRLHGTPVGEVSVRLDTVPVSAEMLARAVWTQLESSIRAHLAGDGLPAVDCVPTGGYGVTRAPTCSLPRDSAALERIPVTVVIATRDRPQSVLRCLDSLADSAYPAFNVVVVDSAPSSDQTARAVRTWAETSMGVHYVRCALPGLARAHNAALPHVTGSIVAFTDDDVLVDRHWVCAIAGPFADPAVACVTGLILPAELETVAQLRIEQAGGFARGFERRVMSLHNRPDDPLFPFTAGRLGSGANMAFRADYLRKVGGFDVATGAGTVARGGDDLLAFLHVILDGQTLVYEPSAIVRHRHHRHEDQLRRQAFGYGVGLGAYLTAAAWGEPVVLARMARRCVPALRHLIARDSAKNIGIPADYPRGLVWRERLGVLTGPIAYARSRASARG